jgi:hypothetical protein
MDILRSGVAEEQGQACYSAVLDIISVHTFRLNINRAGVMSERNRMLGIGLMGIIIGIGIALFFIVLLKLYNP